MHCTRTLLTAVLSVFLAVPLAGLAAPAAPTCPSAAGSAQAALPPGGERLEFDVLRNGKRVGRHVTHFAQDNGYLVVANEMSLRIRLLFIDAYRYRYRAVERWCNGQLVDLEAKVDDNGKRSTILASARGDRLEVTGPHGRADAPLGVFSTNHWHAGVLSAETVLNTLTGRLNRVRLKPCEAAAAREGPSSARCYDYTGELSARVWYDASGRWVGLAFDGEDGSRFAYRCRHCAPGDA